MRKRERENPCGLCGHYHKHEEGEICGICGHRVPNSLNQSSVQVSAYPSEILPEFLYLGSYDNSSRSELLKMLGITRILNTVPAIENLYKNSFTYHSLQQEPCPFDDAIRFLEQCEIDKARVLVHCMSGRNRSPAIVIAYLMKRKGWRLTQSYQWVKDRRPSIDLTQDVYQQLQAYEQKNFGPTDSTCNPTFPIFPSAAAPPFTFGINPINLAPIPAFNSVGAASIFTRPHNVQPSEFTFGATNPPNPNASDISMDSS